MATEYRLSYTASEIDSKLGEISNLAKKSEIPSKTSDLENNSGFVTDVYVKNYAQQKGDYALKSDVPDVSGLAATGYVDTQVRHFRKCIKFTI